MKTLLFSVALVEYFVRSGKNPQILTNLLEGL